MTAHTNFNLDHNAKPVVLVAPLDWGLGHATRCIPIIHQFLNADFEVIIAAEGQQRQLLAQEFPGLLMMDLTGYRLKYSSNKLQTLMKIILQVPKILIRINHENRWLKNVIKQKHLDVVIADNRYGLHHPDVVSVFITHQLMIRSSFGEWVDTLLQKINYRFINRFNYCWVPDMAGDNNLAGALSHPALMPSITTRYVGALSRIRKEKRAVSIPLLVILSGPEPQRSIFEKKILEQLNHLQLAAVMVRGLAGAPAANGNSSLLQIYNHLPAAEMQRVINESEIIISRSGYSTIMDVLPLGKKCIFIPTPGQPEQEYLAAYLAEKGWCCTATQNGFSLAPLLEAAGKLQMPDLADFNQPALIKALADDLRNQLSSLG